MLRLLKYASPVLLAFGPLLTYEYSLLDFAGYRPDSVGILHFDLVPLMPITGPKAEVEMKVRFALTAFGVVLLLVAGYVDAYIPARNLENFRHDYLEDTKATWRKQWHIHQDVRINVMYLRWRFHCPFGRSFKMVWKDGFEPADRDVRLLLFVWQGVCGAAARKKQALYHDFRSNPLNPKGIRGRWLWWNQYRLSGRQLRKTEKLTAILSVPLFELRGAKGVEVWKCVGVINLDTKTDAGADYLAGRKDKLALLLAKHGTLIAKMRS